MATRTPKKPAKSPVRAKRATGATKLSNQELLKLAAKNRPPQAWYDEAVNPFEPKR